MKLEDLKIEHKINEDEFLEVIESVGFKTYPKYQITTALKTTMYMFKVISYYYVCVTNFSKF